MFKIIFLDFSLPAIYHKDMKHTHYVILLVCSFLLLNFSGTALSIEVAPRITDREIVEKLVSLEVGQAALGQRIVDLRSEMRAGQDALRSEMKAGQDALGKRMDDMNSTLHTLFIAVITLIVALFAFIAWDRRTMLKPVVDRLDRLDRAETDIMRDLDINHKDSSLAKDDEKVVSVLRSFSLL